MLSRVHWGWYIASCCFAEEMQELSRFAKPHHHGQGIGADALNAAPYACHGKEVDTWCNAEAKPTICSLVS